MGNVLNIFSPKPKPIVEEAIEVFETTPTAEVIEVEVIDDPVQYDLS